MEAKELYEKIENLEKLINSSEGSMQEKFTKFMKESPDVGPSPEEREKDKKTSEEAMDRKIDAAFEKLRNDNQYIWKQSIALAEQEFS